MFCLFCGPGSKTRSPVSVESGDSRAPPAGGDEFSVQIFNELATSDAKCMGGFAYIYTAGKREKFQSAIILSPIYSSGRGDESKGHSC